MYLTRYQPLKEKLKKREISDRETLPYLIWFCGIEAAALSFPALSAMNKWDITEGILNVIVAVAGVLYVYRRNGGRDGYDVVPKLVILGWVVSIRYVIVAIPIGVPIYLAAHHFGLAGEETTLFDVVFVTVLSAFYFERLGRHVADTNEEAGEQIVPPDRRGKALASR